MGRQIKLIGALFVGLVGGTSAVQAQTNLPWCLELRKSSANVALVSHEASAPIFQPIRSEPERDSRTTWSIRYRSPEHPSRLVHASRSAHHGRDPFASARLLH
jgi:hypothetical protein